MRIHINIFDFQNNTQTLQQNMRSRKAQGVYNSQQSYEESHPLEQVIIMTPTKKTNQVMELREDKSFFKFNPINIENAYLPKLKLSPLSNRISIAYFYRVENSGHIGNLEDWSQSKLKSPTKSHSSKEPVIQPKKKGMKQYTMCLKVSDEKGNLSQNKEIYVICRNPFETDKLLNYFQIKLMPPLFDDKPSFSFGLIDDPNFPKTQKNAMSLSFKLTTQGMLQIYRNHVKIEEILEFPVKGGDILGCGLLYHRKEVILTFNGELILYKFKLHSPEQFDEKEKKAFKTIKDTIKQYKHLFYPFVTFYSKKISIEAIFENSYTNFRFPYCEYLLKLQNKLIEEEMVKEANISDESVYGLVLNYFKYYGYEKTGGIFEAELMKRCMKFYPQNHPIRNKFEYDKKMEESTACLNKKTKQKRIKKKAKRPQTNIQTWGDQADSNSSNSNQEMEEERNQNNNEEKQKESGSDYDEWSNPSFDFGDLSGWNFSNIFSRKSKKTLQPIQQISEQKKQNIKKRKQQATEVRNRKLQKRIQDTRRLEQQKFKSARIQIIKDIKHGRLEQAYKQLQRSYKRIYRTEQYLESFFKANIFLKYYNQHGLAKALEYTKKQHKCFTQYENYLFPFFNPESLKNPTQSNVIYRPLRQILFLICPENRELFNFEKQLEIFSEFINKILCEGSGFMSSSKLELALSHYKLIESKINQYEIPIGGIDLDGMNCI